MISLGRKVLSVAVASSLLVLSNAHATGLGRLTVLSALGQPLHAEIELTSPNKDEVDSLAPKLASSEAFKRANIDFNSALLSLQFAVEQRGGRYVIRVSSTQAMNEPFVDMLLEMNSSNGKLLREYTFLLDPAELKNSQSPQITMPVQTRSTLADTRSSNAGASEPQKDTSVSQVANSKANRNQSKDAKSAGEYQVHSGDTLSKIAGSYKAEGISLDQMLVGLYRANPTAFVGKNMNRLKAGQILTIPDTNTILEKSGSVGNAHSIVVAHAADFNAYRNRLASHVERAEVEKSAEGKQSASGAITTKVNEASKVAKNSPDKLEVSKATALTSAKNANGKNVAEEDKIAKDKAIADANARLKELEKNVGDLQKLLDVKNKDLALKQAELNAKDGAAKLASKNNDSKTEGLGKAPDASLESKKVESPSSAVASASTAVASAVAAKSASVSSSEKVKPVVKRRVIAPPPPPPEVGFFEGLPDMLLPGIAAILALLGGYGIYTSRRKKKLQQFEDSILTGSSMKANSMFGSTGGQSVDTNNSVFNSNFAPSASQLDANEVDPVAEADVYIAYGRDTQAEEILKEALRTQPDRHAVRVKLLEIYFARKDAKLFERLASELYGMTSGEGDEWAQAASMGVVLEPNNPLYAGGKAKPESANSAGLGVGTQPLEDLDPEALLANSLSQDMLEAISIIDTAAQTNKSEAAVVEDSGDKDHLDIGALDFDIDIGDSVPLIPESTKTEVSSIAEESPQVDFGTIDFDFGSTKAEVETAPDMSLSNPTDSDVVTPEEFDLGLGAVNSDIENNGASNSPLGADVSSTPDLIEHSLLDPVENDDFSEIEATQVEQQSELNQEMSSPFEFDLSGIDLNLEPTQSDSLSPSEPAVEVDHKFNAEMATKLDLAVAYHEIGDKEGARELLDEVLKGGTLEQVEKARSMLAQLS